MSLRAAIFDFDGLILDTEAAEFAALNEIYAEHGKSLSYADWSVCIGTNYAFDPYEHLEKMLGKSLDRQELRRRFRAIHRERVSRQELMPGVRERLEEGRSLGVKLGIASSSSAGWAEAHLRERGILGYFDAISVLGDGVRPKPNPDIYLAALKVLDVKSDEALAFEDSANGIAAAKGAGLYCVAVPNSVTRQLDLSAADQKIGSLLDVSLKEFSAKFA